MKKIKSIEPMEKEIETALIKVALKYAESTIATLREPFLVINKNLRIISANQSFYTTFKVAEKETIGQLLPDLGNGQWNIPKLIHLLKQILPQKTVIKNYEVEHEFKTIGHRIMNLNACQLWIPERIAALITEEEEEELILLAIEDITERKQMDKMLRQSENIYRALIETTNTGYVIIDTEGKVIDANAEYVRLAGYAGLDKIRGKSVVEWTADYEKKKNEEAIAKCARDGYIRNLEIDYIDKNGKITPVEINATVAEKNGGRQILTLCRDISERRKMEQKLTNYAEDLEEGIDKKTAELVAEKEMLIGAKAKDEALLASIGDGVIATDSDRRIVVMNKTAGKLLGWKINEAIGQLYDDVVLLEDEKGTFIPPEEKPLNKAFTSSTTTTTTTTTTTLYLLNKNKIKFPIAFTVSPIILDNKIIGAVEIFRDITKEKEIEKLRTDFLSLASHQLRTPLSGTKWLIETMHRGILGEMTKKQKEYLDDIYKINERMIKLVSDILNTLRLESQEALIKKEKIPVSSLFEDILIMVTMAAKKRKITLQNPSNHRVFTIETDPEILKSILGIFLSNAINYSVSGQKVILDVKKESKAVVFFVRDFGIGIPKSEQNKVFERFYRAPNAKVLEPTGSGLALNIAKTLAERIGAEVSFESEENKGSTFYLRIPERSSRGAKERRGTVRAKLKFSKLKV